MPKNSDTAIVDNGFSLRAIVPSLPFIILMLGVSHGASAALVRTGFAAIVSTHSAQCVGVERRADGGSRIEQQDCTGEKSQEWVVRLRAAGSLLVNRRTGRCLSVAEGSTVAGAMLVQSACNAPGRFWDVVSDDDAVMLVSKSSGLCAAVSESAMAAGTVLIQDTCASGNGNRFVIEGGLVESNTPVNLVNRASGLCAVVTGDGAGDVATSSQQECSGPPNGQWTVRAVADSPFFQLVDASSGACLKVKDDLADLPGLVVPSQCAGTAGELWRLRTLGNSSYRLVSKVSKGCLSVNESSLSAGANLVHSACVPNSLSQQWNLAMTEAVFALPSNDAKIAAAAAITSPRSAWSALTPLPTVPVAAANLPDGKILIWSSYSANNFLPIGRQGKTHTAILDPVTGRVTANIVDTTGHDMFCPGTSNLGDGRVLVNGGSSANKTSIYDWRAPLASSWQAADPMGIPRAYQGNTVLADGSVFTLGGSWNGGLGNKGAEVYSVSNNIWRALNGVPLPNDSDILGNDKQGIYRSDNHLWLFTQPEGWVFHAGPSKAMHWIDSKGNGAVVAAGNRGDDVYSMAGNAVLYDRGRILKIGGGPNYDSGNAFRSAYVINIGNRTNVRVRKVAPMNEPRIFANGVVLPTGQVLVVGGQRKAKLFSNDFAVLDPEIWDPVTEVFTKLNNPMMVARNYHSVALLLPDARVIVGGGGLCGSCNGNHPDVQFLTPPYLLKADGTPATRPVILSAPAQIGLGRSATIQTNAPVARCVAVRMSSTTHTVNNDQRREVLPCTATGVNSYTVRIPNNPGLMVPGYWMLFVLNPQGVPGNAAIVKIF